MSFHRLLSKSVFGLFFLVLASAFSLSAFAQNDRAELPVEELTVTNGETRHLFQVEVASTDIQRARGLMFREEMAEDHGMLFVFENEGERFFWMKNTPLPLDIIYISEAGRIVSIAAATVPFSENVIPSGHPARFVLELNAGLSEKLGITVGDTVSSPSMNVE